MKTTPVTRPSKRQFAGRSNQMKKVRIAIERELEAQALLHSEEATGSNGESEEESDLEVPDSENESGVVFD